MAKDTAAVKKTDPDLFPFGDHCLGGKVETDHSSPEEGQWRILGGQLRVRSGSWGMGRSGAAGRPAMRPLRGACGDLGGSLQVEEGGETSAKAQSLVDLLPQVNEPAWASS